MIQVGGGFPAQQIVVAPPTDDSTALLWASGVIVPLVIALVGWWLKK